MNSKTIRALILGSIHDLHQAQLSSEAFEIEWAALQDWITMYNSASNNRFELLSYVWGDDNYFRICFSAMPLDCPNCNGLLPCGVCMTSARASRSARGSL